MSAPTILTVDDSSVLRMALVELFKPYECTLLQAADGEAGLVVAREHRPDLILLDYNMPVLDGIGMLKRLREEPEIRRTPVIMLTANSAPTKRTSCTCGRVKNQAAPANNRTAAAASGRHGRHENRAG